MFTVRPKAIFSRASEGPLTLDWPKGGSGITLLETCLLIAAARIVNARAYFEFGTYLGRTTLNLIMNAHPEATITTMDLPAPVGNLDTADVDVMNAHFAAERMAFEGTKYEPRIRRELMDSRVWSCGDWYRAVCDFVFIDGGHDLATLQADTDNAYKMLRPGGVIVWHDYGNPTYPQVTRWLDGLAIDLVHVADTQLVFYFDPGTR